jgi:hypothetical protein
MGLTTWAKAPVGKILKSDVVVAKNYLTEAEMEDLGRIVSAYLDLAEGRAKRRVPMTMEDWAKIQAPPGKWPTASSSTSNPS